MTYTVFISHGWHDRWIAGQMARLIAERGAEPFVDVFDIRKGDRIAERVRDGLTHCDELLALLTPWSVRRNWVWTEVGSAWGSGKRVVGVLYGLTLTEVEREQGGAACLSTTNVALLDEFDHYLSELTERVKAQQR